MQQLMSTISWVALLC